MDRFKALETFVSVADQRSFAGAARLCGQSAARVTRTIAALETHLGVTLFHRTTRSVALSYEGAALLDRARALLAELREAEHLVMGGGSGEPHGELVITAPVMFGRLHVLPALADLLARHDGLNARLMLIDRNVRIVEEGIDVAVRIGIPESSGLMRLRLGEVRQMLVASPGYLARHGLPQSIDALSDHHCLGGAGIRYDNVWRFGPDGKTRIEITPRLSLNDVASGIAAAEAGCGILNVLSYQVAESLRAGRLVALLDADMPPPLPVQLLYHPARAAMPGVRAFIEAMRQQRARKAWDSAG